jgi:hypothetical protein
MRPNLATAPPTSVAPFGANYRQGGQPRSLAQAPRTTRSIQGHPTAVQLLHFGAAQQCLGALNVNQPRFMARRRLVAGTPTCEDHEPPPLGPGLASAGPGLDLCVKFQDNPQRRYASGYVTLDRAPADSHGGGDLCLREVSVVLQH